MKAHERAALVLKALRATPGGLTMTGILDFTNLPPTHATDGVAQLVRDGVLEIIPPPGESPLRTYKVRPGTRGYEPQELP